MSENTKIQTPGENVVPLNRPFQLGDWRVDPAAGCITRNGEEQHLEPRVMTVLTLLAGHSGEVVSREQLEAQAWAGMVVGYDALASSIIKLRKALGDDSRHPRYIETVSKKGYRLIAPLSHEISGDSKPRFEQPSSQNQKPLMTIVVLALAIIVGVAWVVISGYRTTPPAVSGQNSNAKTLAVMPFTNISNDPQQEYFVEGITDDIITDLSGLSGVVVISRSATNRYQGIKIDPKKVGQELGVDYLLEGSIRKSGKRWRINASLIEAGTGANLWARRFENTESSLFSAQDELASSVVNALALELSPIDKERLQRRATTNFDAYELFLQGQKLFKERTRESNESAQDAYQKAIDLDSSFARAYGALAVALSVQYWRGWSDTPTETLNRASAMANLATQLDPSSPQAYWALGYTLMYQRQLDKAAVAVEHSIEIAPNYADGYGLLGLINNELGNGEEAARLIKKGMALDPHHSWDFPYNLGRAYYILGRYDEAVKNLLEALNRNELAVNPRMFLIASYMAMGRKDDAQWEAEQMRITSPETTISHLEKNYPIADSGLQKRFLDHLRKAGMPE
ncbi:MAG: winged helix-turn-helix domain-containing protein [Gammaproteobacteria bacterium]|nr:winged helix-turn-helix domain-containing protein [Gammaproteobacteria bacterium]